MSTTNVTTGQLLRWHDELKQLGDINSIFFHFNHSKIREFYNKNGLRLDSAFKKMEELRKEFFAIDKDGRVEMQGEGDKKVPVLLADKKREDYDKRVKEIMESQVTIIL